MFFGYGKRIIAVKGLVASVENFNNWFGMEISEPAIANIKDSKANVYLKPRHTSRFYRCRTIPFTLTPKFKAEADRLVGALVWNPIKCSG